MFSKLLLTLFFTITLITNSFANTSSIEPGYEIRVKLTNYNQKIAVLGYHYGDKQYVKDTVDIDKDGYFTFKADTTLECGVYLFIMVPDNNYLQLLVREGDQHFTISTDAKDPYAHAVVKGSADNELFYNYMEFLGKMREKADPLRLERDSTAKTEAEKAKIQEKLDVVDAEVKKAQSDLITKNPNTLTASIIKSSIETEIPKFEGEKKDVDYKRYLFYKMHYFDNINLSDPCMLRSPVMFQKINYYIEKLTPQHPDSVIQSIDSIVKWVGGSQENYKYYLIHFLNSYAKSQIVGMDAVYVHLAKKYYCNGKAPWVEAEQLKKICDNAATIEPILIGKTAPNIRMQFRDSTFTTLYDVKSPYTIMVIWAPDCGHCKKSMPLVLDFYNKFKSKGVEIFGICQMLPDEVHKCWELLDEKKYTEWINVVDPYNMSRYRTIYDVRSTPQIFILDKDKKIISKRIGAEQLEEVMNQIIESDNKKMQEQQKGK